MQVGSGAAQSIGFVDAANFPQDLQRSMAIYGDVRIGDPCERIDASWLSDPDAASVPLVVPVADEREDGTCIIRGYAYRGVPRDYEVNEDRQILFPIYDGDGAVIDHFERGPAIELDQRIEDPASLEP